MSVPIPLKQRKIRTIRGAHYVASPRANYRGNGDGGSGVHDAVDAELHILLTALAAFATLHVRNVIPF